MLAHNRERFHLVEDFFVSNNTDIFCMSERFLDLSVDNIHNGLNINGYTFVRSDHSSNTKCSGGVANYHKDHKTISQLAEAMLLFSSLNQSIALEVLLANNKRFLTALYRSPSQNKNQFDQFCSSFNILMSNVYDQKSLASIITRGFNARSKNRWSQDVTKSRGSIIATVTLTSSCHKLAISYGQYRYLLY